MEKKQGFFCEKCNYSTNKKTNFVRHLGSKKHKKKANLIIQCEIMKTQYTCVVCNFSTFRKTEYTRHHKTEKHLKKVGLNGDANNVCICGKAYVYNSSYNKHIEQCEKYISSVKDKVDMLSEMDNDKLMQFFNNIKKVIDSGDTNNTISIVNNTIINNNNINMNIYLNETFKNAMNITDFINSINYKNKNWYELCHGNFFSSLGHLIINKLNELDIEQRPIHCTDINNKVMYIKDRDLWDQDNNLKMLQAIDVISTKQKVNDINVISDWQTENPEWKNNKKKVREFLQTSANMVRTITKDDEVSILDNIILNTKINVDDIKTIDN